MRSLFARCAAEIVRTRILRTSLVPRPTENALIARYGYQFIQMAVVLFTLVLSLSPGPLCSRLGRCLSQLFPPNRSPHASWVVTVYDVASPSLVSSFSCFIFSACPIPACLWLAVNTVSVVEETKLRGALRALHSAIEAVGADQRQLQGSEGNVSTRGVCWPEDGSEEEKQRLIDAQPQGCATDRSSAKKQRTAFLLQFFLGGFGGGYWYYKNWTPAALQLSLTVLLCCTNIIGAFAGALSASRAEGPGEASQTVQLLVLCCVCIMACGQFGWTIAALVLIGKGDLYPADGCLYVCNL